MVLNTLSTAELEARRKALEGSKARDAEDRAKAAIEAARRAEDEALRAQEREAFCPPSG